MFNWLKPVESQKPKTLGQVGEEIAQKEYKKQGFKIIAQNEYNKKGKRLGEIDFIAVNKTSLIFVEVKTRADEKGLFGSPVEAVDVYKQRKILKAIKFYLINHLEYKDLKPQIDVCVVILKAVDKFPESVKIYMNVVDDWS